MFITKYLFALSALISGIFVTDQATNLASSQIIIQGEKSAQVKDAQQRLQKLGLYKKPINQVYDAYTRNCIAQFQTNYHLPINGILGPETRGKLRQLTTTKQAKPTPVKVKPAKTHLTRTHLTRTHTTKTHTTKIHSAKPTSVKATSAEVHLLAKAVYSEARGEKFAGKVAVAAVILNRTETKGFPRSIKGVIYQPRAFTAVSDGQFGLKPNKEAYRAAYAALRGVDPSKGAIFYYNPNTATSGWMKQEAKKHKTVKIGRHVFFK